MGEIRVHVESASRRTFAAALDWPGWCRSAKDEAGALTALLAYAPRYAAVARDAGLQLPGEPALRVVGRVPGSTTTDFGAPDVPAIGDADALAPGEAARLVGLVEACWRRFDSVAAASPEILRRGPRGGGRDRDAIIDHLLATETSLCAPRLGLRGLRAARGDDAGITAMRAAIAAALGPAPPPPGVGRPGWPPRYAARRIAWHALDHAWEMEDRGIVSPGEAGNPTR
ncbi:MAG: hypothetical protein ABSA40_10120 [Candidatus Dormibacteria bacterium]|jgi:hypothetical protein